MLKKLCAIMIAAMCAVALIGCGGSGSQSSNAKTSPMPTIEPPKDMLIERTVFLSDETDAYSEYVVVYYGSDTHTLVCRFKDLDKKENFVAIHNNGILTLDSTDVDTVDADSVIKHLSSEGYKELQLSEYANVGLHFQ